MNYFRIGLRWLLTVLLVLIQAICMSQLLNRFGVLAQTLRRSDLPGFRATNLLTHALISKSLTSFLKVFLKLPAHLRLNRLVKAIWYRWINTIFWWCFFWFKGFIVLIFALSLTQKWLIERLNQVKLMQGSQTRLAHLPSLCLYSLLIVEDIGTQLHWLFLVAVVLANIQERAMQIMILVLREPLRHILYFLAIPWAFITAGTFNFALSYKGPINLLNLILCKFLLIGCLDVLTEYGHVIFRLFLKGILWRKTSVSVEYFDHSFSVDGWSAYVVTSRSEHASPISSIASLVFVTTGSSSVRTIGPGGCSL